MLCKGPFCHEQSKAKQSTLQHPPASHLSQMLELSPVECDMNWTGDCVFCGNWLATCSKWAKWGGRQENLNRTTLEQRDCQTFSALRYCCNTVCRCPCLIVKRECNSLRWGLFIATCRAGSNLSALLKVSVHFSVTSPATIGTRLSLLRWKPGLEALFNFFFHFYLCSPSARSGVAS